MTFFESIKNGFGFSLGILLMLGILLGVYAFVEPTQGPSVGNFYLHENSTQGVRWAGYTTSNYTGNLGRLGGAHEKCDQDYPGGRAMTWNDLNKLGNKYPWSLDAWLIDGVDSHYTGSAIRYIGKDGSNFYQNAGNGACSGWLSSSPSYYGAYLHSASKYIYEKKCDLSIKIPCVYGQ